jgi:2-methylaconitate cis-trans-isomerase PrpF
MYQSNKKVALIAGNTTASTAKTNAMASSSSPSKPLTNSGLSSEMTSLERRLLSMDKNKKSLIARQPLETAAATTTNTTLTTVASSSSSSKNLNAAKMAELEKKKRDEIRKWLLREFKENRSHHC